MHLIDRIHLEPQRNNIYIRLHMLINALGINKLSCVFCKNVFLKQKYLDLGFWVGQVSLVV